MESIWFSILVVVSLIHLGLSLFALANIRKSSDGFTKYIVLCGWWPFFSRDRFEAHVPQMFGRITLTSILVLILIAPLFWGS